MSPVAVASQERPPSSAALVDIQIPVGKNKGGYLPKEQAKQKSPKDDYGAEFTFHPRVSTASNRIVEQMGTSFSARQQRHLEKQKKHIEENQFAFPNNTEQHNDSKRPKISKNATSPGNNAAFRPVTGTVLTKRAKMPKNNVRRSNGHQEENMETDLPPSPKLPAQHRSQSPPSLPPRAKTVYAGVTHLSVGSSTTSLHGNMRKRNNADPYANFDRLQKAKSIVEKAIRVKKIFSIHGPYPLIRKALRDRGWVEKEFKLPIRKSVNKSSGDASDGDDDDDNTDDDDDRKENEASPRVSNETVKSEEDDDCYGIMGRMVRNEVAHFQWTTRNTSIDWKFLNKDQIVNHFTKANFTTKVGLCMNLRTLPCFTDATSDTFFPRCYRLSNEEDKLDFLDDFRMVAASSMLKIVVSRQTNEKYGEDFDKIQNGQHPPSGGKHVVPVDILQLAIRICELYAKERGHDDIDMDESHFHISEDEWEKIIFHFSKLVHEGGIIENSSSYFSQCEQALNTIKERNPQYNIEGVKNVWIIKPGAKSRGRGIIVMNRLDEILKLVSGDPNLMKDGRWVVQKYIERPLLIHATKFDIRQWFLVTDWNPLSVWIYNECYLRFSQKNFTLKTMETSVHLCNYSVQKNFEPDPNRSSQLPSENMWSGEEFRDYLRSKGVGNIWDDLILPGMKKAIIYVCQTAQDIVDYRKGSFELYGADFMIDSNYNPWLIEVNSSPTMSRSTAVTSRLCADVQEDTLKVVLDRKKDRNCDTGKFQIIYKQSTVDVPLYVGKSLGVEGTMIKKPVVKRIWNKEITANKENASNNNNNNNNSNNSNNNNTASTATSSVSTKQSTPYSNIGTCHTSRTANSSSPNKNSSGNRPMTERSNSPVKIRMQNTISRLANEACNVPNKPNAFNLPKCSLYGSTSSSTNKQRNEAHTNTAMKSTLTVPSYAAAKNTDTAYHKHRYNPVHFVSSSQSKAASSMGIMNLNNPIPNRLIAAANRGCLPSKLNVHASTYGATAIVPKSFPSSVPGGDVGPGGTTLVQPAPPQGVVAVTPQNIGLGLPFQKFFSGNPNAENIVLGQLIQHRPHRNAMHPPHGYHHPDFRINIGHNRRLY